MPTPQVSANEILYRQIGPNGNPIYFDPNRTPLVHQSLFLPSKSDADGLSMIRGRFRTEAWSAYRMERPEVRFRLAVLQSVRLSQIAVEEGIGRLSMLSTADSLDSERGEPWAHCVAAEINWNAYHSDPAAKKRIKSWALKVADNITSREVIGPFPEPNEDTPYRPST